MTEATHVSTSSFVWEYPGSDGVAKIRWAPGVVITEDLARTSLADLGVLTAGKKVPVLADIRKLKSMTREARKHYSTAISLVSAIALLASSPATQVIANFFLGLNRPNVPTQMFTDEEKAVAWLRRHTV